MVSSGRVLSACNYLKNYGRFRENQGFQQTRGLIRLMRVIVSRIWQPDRDPYLIATHETLTEINQINNTLENAIAHDIASGGGAVSETIDANLGGCEDAQDVMRLLLIASLANVPNAVKGLTIPEIVANLCAPGRDVSRLPGTSSRASRPRHGICTSPTTGACTCATYRTSTSPPSKSLTGRETPRRLVSLQERWRTTMSDLHEARMRGHR